MLGGDPEKVQAGQSVREEKRSLGASGSLVPQNEASAPPEAWCVLGTAWGRRRRGHPGAERGAGCVKGLWLFIQRTGLATAGWD